MVGHQTTIDPGGEEEVRVTGYCTSTPRLLPTALLTLLTGGLPLLVFRWRPSWRLALTSHPASLASADRVLVEHKVSGDTSLETVVEEEVGAGEQVPGEFILRGEAPHHSDRTHLLEEGGGATIRYFTSRHIRYHLAYVWSILELMDPSLASMSLQVCLEFPGVPGPGRPHLLHRRPAACWGGGAAQGKVHTSHLVSPRLTSPSPAAPHLTFPVPRASGGSMA